MISTIAHRMRRLLVVAAAAVAAASLAVPVAAGDPGYELGRGEPIADASDRSIGTVIPDGLDRYLAGRNRSPQFASDALDRYVAGRNRSAQFVPDALDRYVAANAHRLAGRRLAEYDSFRVGSPLAAERPTGGGIEIDWPSVGLGAGGAVALALLAASALAAGRSHRRIARSS
jgi:hypothetical protein